MGQGLDVYKYKWDSQQSFKLVVFWFLSAVKGIYFIFGGQGLGARDWNGGVLLAGRVFVCRDLRWNVLLHIVSSYPFFDNIFFNTGYK
jgi:hypothetical protein